MTHQPNTPASRTEAVAVLRFERNVPGRENDMPRVVSCNWQPDGEYPVYLASRTEQAVPSVASGAVAFLDLARLYCAVTETPSGDLEWSFRQCDMEYFAAEVISQQRASGDLAAPVASGVELDKKLLAYVLQDEEQNRLTPRVIDIAYTAFMIAKQPDAEDGGSSDWFNDTRPVVKKAIEKLRTALAAPSADIAAREQEAIEAVAQQAGALITLKDGSYGNVQAGAVIFAPSEWQAFCAALASRPEPPAVDAGEKGDSAMQNQIEAIWMYAQLYADEHAASIDPLRTHAAIEGAKRRKMQHEVALRQSVRELAAIASRPEAPPASASSATAAQPVGWQVRGIGREDGPGEWHHADAEDLQAYQNGPDMWELRPVFAQPCASQGCGGDVALPRQFLIDLSSLLRMGESHNEGRVWASAVRELVNRHFAALSTDKGDGGSEQ